MRISALRLRSLELSQAGFTLIEALVVIVIVGILMAIAAPSWFSLLERQRVTTAQSAIDQGLRQAQSNAQRTAKDWRFALKQGAEAVEWAIYPRYDTSGNTIDPTDSASQVIWNSFHPNVVIDASTGASQSGINGAYHSAIYNYKGHANKRLTFTVASARDSELKRCVIMSTILGNTRKAKNEQCL